MPKIEPSCLLHAAFSQLCINALVNLPCRSACSRRATICRLFFELQHRQNSTANHVERANIRRNRASSSRQPAETSNKNVPPVIASFTEEFYNVSDTPDVHSQYADFFISDEERLSFQIGRWHPPISVQVSLHGGKKVGKGLLDVNT